ncbi:aldehyde dehydrogenase family protein [Rhizobium giardinii]|uniref:Acyl-CoA reductase-like NAD-dependent aldehyde dehydrogenase n=1 Tax=Rhizobium giardinii TaxID=56731 RepID=A0A7W8UH47_9HYPH|nr:aldehyde dehydrogenase family protein [Rhizobium giardinii]MBB5539143.1 acyl-CoA reductase-like NAD-dependent aldehyde dehydrogenase [Rhizobium giardinii]
MFYWKNIEENTTPPEQKLFIGGHWSDASHAAYFEDRDPTTGRLIARIADSTSGDIDRAIAAAAGVQPMWEELSPTDRASFFYRAAELFVERRDDFARALIAETGSTFGKAMYECSLIPVALREAAGLTTREIGEVLPSNVPGRINRTMRRPRGVIGVISPWNFPLYLSVRGFVYALALGNTIVLKPSEDSPVSGGLMLAHLLSDAGFPPGVFNVVTASRESAPRIGTAFVNDKKVAGISFTGSTKVGQQLSAECARLFKPIMLELGGKNSILVLEDADLDHAVDLAFFGAFLHQGQICMSTDRVIVAKALYDEFTRNLVEKVRKFAPCPPDDPHSVIGPIINDRQLQRVVALVDEARAAGAIVCCGGHAQAPFYQPTVLTGITPGMRIWNEEIFGPVTCVVPADDTEHAIALANDSDYGLTAAIVTADGQAGEILAERINAGMVHVNASTVHDEPHCPFSGIGASGGGGKWGPKGAIEAFTVQRWISTQRRKAALPF